MMWGWSNQLSLPRVEAELGFDNSNILNKPYSIIDKYAFPDEASLRSPWVSASWAIDHAGLHQYIYHYVCLLHFLCLGSFVSNITILDMICSHGNGMYILTILSTFRVGLSFSLDFNINPNAMFICIINVNVALSFLNACNLI